MPKLLGGIVLRKSINSDIKYVVEYIEYHNQLVQGSVAILVLKNPVSQQEPQFTMGDILEFKYSNSQEDRTFQIVSVIGPAKLEVKQIF